MKFNRRAKLSVSAFSLLEVMFSLVILSMSLIVLMQNQTQSIALTQKAKAWDTATSLASGKMSELVLTVEKKGITALKNEESGDFNQDKFPSYKWRYRRQSVPAPNFQAIMGAATQSEDSAPNAGAAALAGPLQTIAKAWSECLFELTVEVIWGEGESQRNLEITTHLLAQDSYTKIQGVVATLGAKQ